jgi:hypothetical protein
MGVTSVVDSFEQLVAGQLARLAERLAELNFEDAHLLIVFTPGEAL